ncbi:MAG: type II secretion system F family protein [Actinobacteria bacterium]|nr:type II secretion system F family protein [Actinomycetota bacterium]
MILIAETALSGNAAMTVGLVLAGSALGLVVYVGISTYFEKQAIRNSIRQLEDYGQASVVESDRDRELLRPAYERALTPIFDGAVNVGRRLMPSDFVEKTRQKMQAAGRYDPSAVDRFIALQIACLLLVPLAFVLFPVMNVFGLSMKMNVIAFLLLAAVGVFLPSSRLTSSIQERQKRIQRQLPDILDLLVISVEAGLGFEQALDRTVASVPGELSLEFARMLGETRAGVARADALRAMEERIDVPEVRSFVLAVIQADTFGVSIGQVLRGQADEMRIKRRQLAQERAQKAPVKMLIPMVFCVFPSLFVVVIGPAIISIRHAFGA